MSSITPDEQSIHTLSQEIVIPPLQGTVTIPNLLTTMSSIYFAKDHGRNLYYYSNGVYKPNGEDLIDEIFIRILTSSQQLDEYQPSIVEKLVRIIKGDRARLLWEIPPSDKVNLKNGIFDLEAQELKPHSPQYLSPVQLPITYDPLATCPGWKRFIEDTFPSDANDDIEETAWKIITMLMTPNINIHKLVLLKGEGSNGKSTFLKAVNAFLGESNVSHVNWHQLEKDKFTRVELLGKLANTCGELSDRDLPDTNVIKMLASFDPISIEYKYGRGFSPKLFARMIFSSNSIPDSRDKSKGLLDRYLIIPFNKTFPRSVEMGNSLDQELAQPSELSGVLNKAITLYSEVKRFGISDTPSTREEKDEYRNMDPIIDTLASLVILEPTNWVSRIDIQTAINESLRHQGLRPLDPRVIGKWIKKLYPQVTSGKQTSSEIRGYWGIRLNRESLYSEPMSEIMIHPKHSPAFTIQRKVN